MAISQTMHKIIQIFLNTLDEAIKPNCSPTTAPLLYKTAPDVLNLFRVIIPIKHVAAITTIPPTTAILHNDCVYLNHHILTLIL